MRIRPSHGRSSRSSSCWTCDVTAVVFAAGPQAGSDPAQAGRFLTTPKGSWPWQRRRKWRCTQIDRAGYCGSDRWKARLPGPLAEFSKRYPEVVLEMRTGNPVALSDVLCRGDIHADDHAVGR